MIHNVQKTGENKFLINDSVLINDLSINEDGNVVYDIGYKESDLTESEAVELAEEFLKNAIDSFIKAKES